MECLSITGEESNAPRWNGVILMREKETTTTKRQCGGGIEDRLNNQKIWCQMMKNAREWWIKTCKSLSTNQSVSHRTSLSRQQWCRWVGLLKRYSHALVGWLIYLTPASLNRIKNFKAKKLSEICEKLGTSLLMLISYINRSRIIIWW